MSKPLKNGLFCLVINIMKEPRKKKAESTAVADNCNPHQQTDEFSLISSLLSIAGSGGPESSPIIIGPGDDAALLKSLSNPVISSDTQREGVHFRTEWQGGDEIGFKAVTITLSDLAASYAVPVALFVNISIPADCDHALIRSIYSGIHKALNHYSCSLGGGNVSRSAELALDLFAIGEGNNHVFPRRSCAMPGDGLYVTGPLGLARAGLDALTRKRPATPLLINAFKCPSARFDAATILQREGVKCVMDISDGLSGDAIHIANASDISIEFSLTPDLFPDEFREYCRQNNISESDMALAGGEDYELLFTCSPKCFDRIQPSLPEAFRVGTCMDYSGTRLINPPETMTSFRHSH